MNVSSLLKKMDFFAETLKLNFDKKRKFGTELGGVFTLIIFSLTLALVVDLSQVLIDHTLPRTNSVLLHSEYAPKIDINPSLLIAFGFEQTVLNYRFIDPTYFTFTAQKFVLKRTSDGELDINIIDLPINVCSNYSARWETKTFNYSQKYSSNNLGMMFCFQNNSGTMEGAFAADYFENFKFEVTRCKNGTKPGIVCKSNEEISSTLLGSVFQLFYTNRFLDVFNFTNPSVEFFDNYFARIDQKLTRNVDIFFKKVNVTTDQGYVFEEKETKSYVLFDRFREQLEFNDDNEKIITIYISSSQDFLDVSRGYLKVTELAATVGGILNICLVICRLIARYLGNFQMKLHIMDRLYFFNITEEKEQVNAAESKLLQLETSTRSIVPEKAGDLRMKPYLSNIKHLIYEEKNLFKESDSVWKSKNELNQQGLQNASGKTEEIRIVAYKARENAPDTIKSFKRHEPIFATEEQHQELLQNIKKHFNEHKNQSQNTAELLNKVFQEITYYKKNQKGRLNYGYKDIIGAALCFCFGKNKTNSKIIEIGDNGLNNYLDYLGIVKLLQEFEKLKSIIFSEEKRDLFENTRKEVININTYKIDEMICNSEKLDQFELNYEDLYRKYREVYLSTEKQEFDKRLLNKLDSELKLPFDMLLSREITPQGKS